jgi:hypothetical protein
MVKVCACGCGESFEARHPARLYLDAAHRQRGHRAPRDVVVGLPPPPVEPGELEVGTMAELVAVGREGGTLGLAALMAARRLDQASRETAGGVATLLTAYRATLAEAVKDAGGTVDALDQIRGSAALKLLAGGRA